MSPRFGRVARLLTSATAVQGVGDDIKFFVVVGVGVDLRCQRPVTFAAMIPTVNASTNAAPERQLQAWESTGPALGLGAVGIFVRVIAAIGLLVAGFVPAVLFSNLVTSIVGDEALEGALPAVAVALSVHLVFLAAVLLEVWLWLRFVERRRLRTAGWRWDRLSVVWLLVGIVVTGVLVFVTTALLPATGAIASESEFDPKMPIVASLTIYVSQAFVLQAIPEELIFRGWLLTAWRERPIRAITVSTLAFTAIHLISSGGQTSVLEHFLYLTDAFGFALLAVGLMLWTGSLWSAIGVHGGFHLGHGATVLFLPEVNAPLSWVVVGTVLAVAGLALIVPALLRHRPITA